LTPGRGTTEAPTRAITYCIVPRELADELHEVLRRHFQDEPEIEVVVEARVDDRRRTSERRATTSEPAAERRRIRAAHGRRVADRRATAMAVDAPRLLPRRARRHAGALCFTERLEPSTQQLEDADTARLVIRIQGGDRDAFADLYMRYFDRVYGYLNIGLRDRHEAEDVTQQVFVKVFESLPAYVRRGQPFRAWLFRIARNTLLDTLKKLDRLDPVDPVSLGGHGDEHAAPAAPIEQLAWISDRELLMFVERLPLAQRQVLVLKYLLGLSTAEIGSVLHRKEPDVRRLEFRALEFLRERLLVVRRVTVRAERGMLARGRRGPALVLRERRFALQR
jgi:RNA polymerase sigma-70 factor (ECF subfamily)